MEVFTDDSEIDYSIKYRNCLQWTAYPVIALFSLIILHEFLWIKVMCKTDAIIVWHVIYYGISFAVII